MSADRGRDERGCALERHAHDVDFEAKPEQPLARQLPEADAHAGIAVLAGLGLCECDQLLHGLCRQRRIHDHHLRGRRHDADRREIPHRVVAQLGGGGPDGEIIGRDEERVPVGRRFGRGAGADGAACAAQVFDVELLAEMLRHVLRHQARDQIGRAARRVGHDDAHRAGWIVGRSCLGMACASDKQRQQRGDDTDRDSHA